MLCLSTLRRARSRRHPRPARKPGDRRARRRRRPARQRPRHARRAPRAPQDEELVTVQAAFQPASPARPLRRIRRLTYYVLSIERVRWVEATGAWNRPMRPPPAPPRLIQSRRRRIRHPAPQRRPRGRSAADGTEARGHPDSTRRPASRSIATGSTCGSRRRAASPRRGSASPSPQRPGDLRAATSNSPAAPEPEHAGRPCWKGGTRWDASPLRRRAPRTQARRRAGLGSATALAPRAARKLCGGCRRSTPDRRQHRRAAARGLLDAAKAILLWSPATGRSRSARWASATGLTRDSITATSPRATT